MTAPANIQVPSKPVERGAATMGSQRDRRFLDTYFDTYRHAKFPKGRPFTGPREFKSGVSEPSETSGFLVSDLSPGEYFCENPALGQTLNERAATLASAWEPRWLPPGGKKYMEFNHRLKRITFRYAAFINDERAALSQYWDAAAKLAGESDIIDPDRPDAVPFRIRSILGRPQTFTNKIRLATACIAGDPWIMGAVDTPNEELVKLLGFSPIQYTGGAQAGDASYVSVPAQKAPEPLVTPAQVLSVPVSEVNALIEAALAKRDAEDKAKRKAAGDRLAAGKAKAKAARKTTEVLTGAAE